MYLVLYLSQSIAGGLWNNLGVHVTQRQLLLIDFLLVILVVDHRPLKNLLRLVWVLDLGGRSVDMSRVHRRLILQLGRGVEQLGTLVHGHVCEAREGVSHLYLGLLVPTLLDFSLVHEH